MSTETLEDLVATTHKGFRKKKQSMKYDCFLSVNTIFFSITTCNKDVNYLIIVKVYSFVDLFMKQISPRNKSDLLLW